MDGSFAMLAVSLLMVAVYVLEIHTDGACSGNQNDENVGGWGAILKYNSNEKELFGGEVNTTNNRMELITLLDRRAHV